MKAIYNDPDHNTTNVKSREDKLHAYKSRGDVAKIANENYERGMREKAQKEAPEAFGRIVAISKGTQYDENNEPVGERIATATALAANRDVLKMAEPPKDEALKAALEAAGASAGGFKITITQFTPLPGDDRDREIVEEIEEHRFEKAKLIE